jgi:hypothetical protein
MVTDDDVNNIKKKLGGDAKYLDDWQLKTYALVDKNKYLLNDNLLNNFETKLKDVYHNTIMSGRGYDDAISQIRKMNIGKPKY